MDAMLKLGNTTDPDLCRLATTSTSTTTSCLARWGPMRGRHGVTWPRIDKSEAAMEPRDLALTNHNAGRRRWPRHEVLRAPDGAGLHQPDQAVLTTLQTLHRDSNDSKETLNWHLASSRRRQWDYFPSPWTPWKKLWAIGITKCLRVPAQVCAQPDSALVGCLLHSKYSFWLSRLCIKMSL